MKKLTKILAFFLAGAAAAGCLSACVKQDPLAKGKDQHHVLGGDLPDE